MSGQLLGFGAVRSLADKHAGADTGRGHGKEFRADIDKTEQDHLFSLQSRALAKVVDAMRPIFSATASCFPIGAPH
jgi:hypothetical protein